MKYRLRILMIFLFSAGICISVPACNQAAEGDRCNPARAANGEDECGAGLSCQQPMNCPENYCCPKTGNSSNPYCQTGCNGGDISICMADSTQPFCPELCKKDPTLSWCMVSAVGGAGGATGVGGAP